MNIIEVMSSINKYGRYFVLLVVLANIVSTAYADGGGATENIRNTLTQFCTLATTVLAAAIVVMIIMAAVIYAIGQVLGAETRARASVWATAMLTGAVIGAVIYILTPYILSLLLAGQINIDLGNPCNFDVGPTP